jgi:hypothetical protein
MKYSLIIALCLCQWVAFCQTQTTPTNVDVTLPSLALLDMENSGGINLGFSAPSEAGSSLVNNGSNNSAWLNFTSALRVGTSRNISVQLSSGSSSGYVITLQPQVYSGIGSGQLGTIVQGTIALSNMSQKIIDNIGGAYTGNGLGNGYNLRYSLTITDFGALRKENSTFIITYTLTDN